LINPLGYINTYWFREFMLFAIVEIEDWLCDQNSYEYYLSDASFMIQYRFNNRTNVARFINEGLLPVFKSLNLFQRKLVVEAPALLIAKDSPDLWKYANLFEHHIYNEYTLTEDSSTLFTEFFDALAVDAEKSISDYIYFDNFIYDEGDTLELYR
jgi:hypothetical protein